jgi:hypothetical protein
MFVSCTVFVLSGRGLCNGLIPRPEESYRMWGVSACDREASIKSRPWPTWRLLCHWKNICSVRVTTQFEQLYRLVERDVVIFRCGWFYNWNNGHCSEHPYVLYFDCKVLLLVAHCVHCFLHVVRARKCDVCEVCGIGNSVGKVISGQT